MIKRYSEIIEILNDHNDWMSSRDIALLLGYSQSSIKSSIQSINRKLQNVIEASNLGYRLNIDLVNEAFSTFVTNVNADQSSPYSRRLAILSKLINSKGRSNTFDFTQELYISETTLKSDINQINEKIKKYDMKISQFGYEIELVGEESSKRKLFIDEVYKDSNSNMISQENIQALFNELDIEKLSSIISSSMESYDIYIDEYSFLDILLHVALMIERIKQNHFLSNQSTLNVDSDIIIQITNDIILKISNEIDITFTDNEVNELFLLLASKVPSLEISNITVENIKEYVPKRTMVIVDEIVDFLSDFYKVSLQDDTNYFPFVIHINNLLRRVDAGHFLKNPLTDSLKNSHPFVYQLAVSIGEIIVKNTNTIIPNDEIAYIALHLGGSFAKEDQKYKKITVALVSPNARSLPFKLKDKIEDLFSSYLYVERIYTSIKDKMDLSFYNAIITTVPLSLTIDAPPVIMISPLFGFEDERKIYSFIENFNLKEQHSNFRNAIHSISDPSYFMINSVISTRKEVIDVVSDIFVNQGIVNVDFKDNVFHRERLSSTAFQKIAIPHTLKMDAIVSKMYIIVSEKPISWGEDNVNIILLFAINEQDRQFFYSVFEILSLIYSNPINVIKSIQAKDYDAFIDFITTVPITVG